MNAAALDRLRAGGTDRLADLLLDDVLDRPVREWVDAEWFARQLAQAARSAAADPQVERRLHEAVRDLRDRVPSGPVSVPASIRGPLTEVLERPFVPDRAIVGRLLDHDTARLLLREVFGDVLVAFGRRLRALPGPKLPRLSKLGGGILEAVGGAVAEEFERTLEARAREFMDAAVQKLVDKMADHLCDPKLVKEYGAWRTHVLHVVLATDRQHLAGEIEKLDPDALIATGAALVRGIVERPSLVGELRSVIDHALGAAGDRSARELLDGAEAHGLDAVRDLLRQRARAVVETPAFAVWWDEVVEGR